MKSEVVVVFAKATHPEMRVRKDGVTQRYHVGREAERPATIDVDGVPHEDKRSAARDNDLSDWDRTDVFPDNPGSRVDYRKDGVTITAHMFPSGKTGWTAHSNDAGMGEFFPDSFSALRDLKKRASVASGARRAKKLDNTDSYSIREALEYYIGRMGLDVSSKSSGASGSQYIFVDDPRSPGDEIKIRISDHVLPASHKGEHGRADFEVSPAGRAHGETEGQWFNALVWLAEKTGAKAPANAARLHKQDTGRRRVSDGDMTKSTQSLILFLKAHVRAYTRRDGTMVEAHEDKRPAARAKAKEDNRTADMFASQQKPAREYPRGATEEQGDMFGGGDTPSHKPHEQLSAALKRGDLSGAMAVLSPLDKTGVEDALLHSGFEVSGSSKAEVISRAQQKLVEAAKRKTDGHGLRDGSDTITMPRAEAIKEHERLVGVLNSPSHADDKAEAKKQAAEPAEMKQEVGEHDHLLSDIPGAKWKRGKGLIAGHYGVEVDGDVLGNYHAKPEDAAAEAKGVLAVRVASAEQKARTSAAMAALRERIEGGGDVTDADLNLLGLRPRSSGLDWFIPAAASLFGISSRAVRPHIKDLIRIGHTDMGVKKEFVDPKKALRAIAGARKPASPHPTETPEFKRWFGDSKVVGADGEPRIVLPKGKKSENNSFHRVRISSPFGKFDVYVDHHKDATPDDYKRDAKTAFLNDSGAGSGFASSSQIKVMGEPEQVSSHPSSATRAKGADWAKIVRAEDSLDHHIKLAADSIEKLRKPDVYRVLESAGKDREKLAAHISDKRPDLADEVREIMTDEFS